jgi:peptidoglycan hydrolase CwlO-like protein
MEDNSTTYTSKKMQYAKLHAELKKLEKNIETLDRNVKDTVEQVPSFRKMGTLHASL